MQAFKKAGPYDSFVCNQEECPENVIEADKDATMDFDRAYTEATQELKQKKMQEIEAKLSEQHETLAQEKAQIEKDYQKRIDEMKKAE